MSKLYKCIKENIKSESVYLVGIDSRKIKKNKFLDNFYQIKNKNDSFYVKKLINICKKEKIHLVVPYSDREVRILSKNL